MTVEVTREVWKIRGMQSGRKTVLLCFADHATDGDHRAWPSQETVAAETGMGLSTVREHIRALRKAGYLLQVGHGAHGNDIYNVECPLRPPETGYLTENRPPKTDDLEIDRPPESGDLDTRPPDFSTPDRQISANRPPDSGGKPSVNHQLKPLLKQQQQSLNSLEEKIPAAADLGYLALNTFQKVTGFPAIPGAGQEASRVMGILEGFCERMNSHAPDYLRPFYLAQLHARGKNGRSYSRSALFWLTDWAVSGEIPDYVLVQLAPEILGQMGPPWEEKAQEVQRRAPPGDDIPSEEQLAAEAETMRKKIQAAKRAQQEKKNGLHTELFKQTGETGAEGPPTSHPRTA